MPRDASDTRINPDQLLAAIQKEEDPERHRRGHLKIFFGYAAGVGKTYTMLQAAHAAKNRGVDVVVGYVEPHARPETSALLAGLEIIPTKKVSYSGITLNEFDLDATILRAPQLVLVDEFAHTNAEGCRHAKRYQDVEELLKAGINVYTTVNVQHIESLNDMVASITGVIVRERIPDRLFDDADQVELVDIEPADLLERLSAGKVYREEQASRAVENFFTVDNLTALREIALRRCADRVNRLSDHARVRNNRDYYTSEHILVCLSGSPSNPRIIRTAARMAAAFRGPLTALYVESPNANEMSDAERDRLRDNMNLAEQLGAKVETAYGDDVAFQIAEFARLSGASKIVMGRNNETRGMKKHLFGKGTLTEHLIAIAPNLDIYIIPDKKAESVQAERNRSFKPISSRLNAKDTGSTLLLLVLATAIGFLFRRLLFVDSSIISVYILVTLLTAITTTSRLYPLACSVLSVALYNFCFVPPFFTFQAFDRSYTATFLIMFVTATVASTLTTRISRHAQQSAQNAYRMRVLFETNQLLQQGEKREDIIEVATQQLVKLLNRDVIFYPAEGGKLGEPHYAEAGTPHEHAANVSGNERAVANWAFKNNKHAGATTSTLPNSRCLYLAVRVNEDVYGVVGIPIDHKPLDAFENSIVLSIIGECALALESDHAAAEREEAAILARSERLRANLLRSLGHDLRTPLTSISGSAGILLEDTGDLAPEKRRELASNIYDDSLWLINLVENLLSVTRIEDGTMKLKLNSELMDDAINEAVSHLSRESEGHHVVVNHPSSFILARMDIALIVQVLVNIIDNAIKYTPKGSTITISSRRQGPNVLVEVADDGPGIPDTDKPRIFDMFYTSSVNKPVDSRRSLGLGLSLCKSIVNAHGGDISVADARPHGTIVRFTLPAEEVDLHE